MNEAQSALEELDGELGAVSFDPSDPSSIEQAINQAERLLDDRVGRYASNELVKPLVEQAKEHFRSEILSKAAQARLEGDDG